MSGFAEFLQADKGKEIFQSLILPFAYKYSPLPIRQVSHQWNTFYDFVHGEQLMRPNVMTRTEDCFPGASYTFLEWLLSLPEEGRKDAVPPQEGYAPKMMEDRVITECFKCTVKDYLLLHHRLLNLANKLIDRMAKDNSPPNIHRCMPPFINAYTILTHCLDGDNAKLMDRVGFEATRKAVPSVMKYFKDLGWRPRSEEFIHALRDIPFLQDLLMLKNRGLLNHLYPHNFCMQHNAAMNSSGNFICHINVGLELLVRVIKGDIVTVEQYTCINSCYCPKLIRLLTTAAIVCEHWHIVRRILSWGLTIGRVASVAGGIGHDVWLPIAAEWKIPLLKAWPPDHFTRPADPDPLDWGPLEAAALRNFDMFAELEQLELESSNITRKDVERGGKRGFLWGKRTCQAAVTGKSLQALQLLRSKKKEFCPWDDNAIKHEAVWVGDLKILQFLHGNQYTGRINKWGDWVVPMCIDKGHWDVLIWLRSLKITTNPPRDPCPCATELAKRKQTNPKAVLTKKEKKQIKAEHREKLKANPPPKKPKVQLHAPPFPWAQVYMPPENLHVYEAQLLKDLKTDPEKDPRLPEKDVEIFRKAIYDATMKDQETRNHIRNSYPDGTKIQFPKCQSPFSLYTAVSNGDVRHFFWLINSANIVFLPEDALMEELMTAILARLYRKCSRGIIKTMDELDWDLSDFWKICKREVNDLCRLSQWVREKKQIPPEDPGPGFQILEANGHLSQVVVQLVGKRGRYNQWFAELAQFLPPEDAQYHKCQETFWRRRKEVDWRLAEKGAPDPSDSEDEDM
uniref:Uncharacterized protein n=1 Tax=Chromera velia CCMP2878 TaxID=1169474 RepID=A0A0G4HIA9_9ALVE|eukprot:Cvel_6937.t1-p1 / transcript=Cvel_6937.t1 / gene=Cvel_6937 / organism=Chromera_velia_CCMP2878 / gene_product=hypothetical protein / transcript_product=hypothetical protein / location=Cvel_scaffold351:36644-41395(-) / protein_length=794 / sequence_SO=supercontig / SO=protein_coding / is_pseudo=false